MEDSHTITLNDIILHVLHTH